MDGLGLTWMVLKGAQMVGMQMACFAGIAAYSAGIVVTAPPPGSWSYNPCSGFRVPGSLDW
jgi:hypothetical protein